ncbi:head decoration protein [Rhizosaccharibacter radicis]|uniref:Head decoration protein n=1 Tax=Rhizosaccharibacter radicis TaxID=2782605 RepID=A0ABT1VW08_9PROT|nr:head decoration protein [Acetobacteraceae bacterium KSS12]
MTLITTTIGDNTFTPGVAAFTYQPDQLIAGPQQPVTHDIEVMSGVLPRGTIMGRQTTFTVLATSGATNTGNGNVGSITPGRGIESGGSYTLTAQNATTFSVVDPEGQALPSATVGTAYTNGEINFTINAGSTAFAAGDSFTLSYQNTVGSFVACVKTATDGSQTPVCILADNVDASTGPAKVGAYFMGEFNRRAITYDNSWLLADLAAALGARGVNLKSSVSAADPS